MSRGDHTQWQVPQEHRSAPAHVEAGAAIALGQAVFDVRGARGVAVGEPDRRTGLGEDELSLSFVPHAA